MAIVAARQSELPAANEVAATPALTRRHSRHGPPSSVFAFPFLLGRVDGGDFLAVHRYALFPSTDCCFLLRRQLTIVI